MFLFPTRMDSDAHFEGFTSSVRNWKVADFGEEVKSEGGDFCSVLVSVADGQSAGHHVGVADRLHFVGVVILQNGIEQCVELVQQSDNLCYTRQVLKKDFFLF